MAKQITADDSLIYKNASGKFESISVDVENYIMNENSNGTLTLINHKTGEELGSVIYNIDILTNNKKILHFENLRSNVAGKGVGTKLILELTKISKELGAEGTLTAGAGILVTEHGRPKTNIPFYYKCGFQATNPDRHNEIKEHLEKGEEVPLRLNVGTEVRLSKEAAVALEQKAIVQQQEFEKQQMQQTTENLQQKINKKTDAKTLEQISKKLKEKDKQ